jgi:hypothetical protein
MVQEMQRGFEQYNLVVPPDMAVSPHGRVCDCCIDAIEGDTLVDVIDRLREVDPATTRITVVREGMTNAFLDLVSRLPTLRRVLICSPWVNLGMERLRSFAYGVEKTKRTTGFLPEVSVVTRPAAEQPQGPQNATLNYLDRINAVVFYRPNLHSKLYVVETGTNPPQRYAFVGSENFTKVRYQELGIRVQNDNLLIDELVRHFLKLAS